MKKILYILPFLVVGAFLQAMECKPKDVNAIRNRVKTNLRKIKKADSLAELDQLKDALNTDINTLASPTCYDTNYNRYRMELNQEYNARLAALGGRGPAARAGMPLVPAAPAGRPARPIVVDLKRIEIDGDRISKEEVDIMIRQLPAPAQQAAQANKRVEARVILGLAPDANAQEAMRAFINMVNIRRAFLNQLQAQGDMDRVRQIILGLAAMQAAADEIVEKEGVVLALPWHGQEAPAAEAQEEQAGDHVVVDLGGVAAAPAGTPTRLEGGMELLEVEERGQTGRLQRLLGQAKAELASWQKDWKKFRKGSK